MWLVVCNNNNQITYNTFCLELFQKFAYEQITPVPTGVIPNWSVLLRKMVNINEARRNAIELLGLSEAFWVTIERNKPDMQKIESKIRQRYMKSACPPEMKIGDEEKNTDKTSQTKEKSKLVPLGLSSKEKAYQLLQSDVLTASKRGLIHDDLVQIADRLFSALILCDLILEKPVAAIASDFQVERGIVQYLQKTVATFGGMVSVFCEKLDWFPLHLLILDCVDRYIVVFTKMQVEMDLTKPNTQTLKKSQLGDIMTRRIASILVNNGVKDVMALAQYQPGQVQKILVDSKPFQIEE
ncbi:hypothetical protein RFI_16365, partial [Reticulomyxa filosa]